MPEKMKKNYLSSYFLVNIAVFFFTNDYKPDLKLSFCHTCPKYTDHKYFILAMTLVFDT